MRLLVFGDSITYGAWDTEGGWVENIKRAAHAKTVESQGETKIQVMNLGIGGDTSTKILNRMQHEIEARRSASWSFVFLLMLGTNDERSLNGKIETSLEQFEDNLTKIIKLAKQYTEKVVFLGIPPIAEPVVIFNTQEYSDERIKIYEKRMEALIKDAGLPFIPIRPAFEGAGLDGLYASDKVHPNNAGHALIADVVLHELNALGIFK